MLERLSFCPETTHEKKNMRICLLFVSLLTLSHCGEIQFTDCGSRASNVKLRVDRCEGVHCVLVKGQPVVVEFDFTPASPTSSVIALVYGIISGTHVPFDEVAQDACPSIGGCPISAGQNVYYSTSIPILPDYPTSLPWCTNHAKIACYNSSRVCLPFALAMDSYTMHGGRYVAVLKRFFVLLHHNVVVRRGEGEGEGGGDLSAPLNDADASISYSFPMMQMREVMKLTAKYELWDADNHMLVCVTVPVDVVSP